MASDSKTLFGFTIVYVKDIDKAKHFYINPLAFRIERDAPTFVQFEHFAIANDAPLGHSGGPELYWLVDDADIAFRDPGAMRTVSHPLKTTLHSGAGGEAAKVRRSRRIGAVPRAASGPCRRSVHLSPWTETCTRLGSGGAS